MSDWEAPAGAKSVIMFNAPMVKGYHFVATEPYKMNSRTIQLNGLDGNSLLLMGIPYAVRELTGKERSLDDALGGILKAEMFTSNGKSRDVMDGPAYLLYLNSALMKIKGVGSNKEPVILSEHEAIITMPDGAEIRIHDENLCICSAQQYISQEGELDLRDLQKYRNK